MTEISMPWNGIDTGDAMLAPYDAPDEWASIQRALSGTEAATDKSGVIQGVLGSLEASAAGQIVTVQDGWAIVHGTVYKNDAAVQFTIGLPSGATRVDRIVLQKDWTAQTVRLVHLENGSEGTGTPPALTQNATGPIWESRLWKVTITTGGVITLENESAGVGILPTTIQIGDTGAVGGSGIPADASHEHPVVNPGNPTAIPFDGTVAEGTSFTPSREDHKHETPKVWRARLSSDAASKANDTPTAITGLAFTMESGEVYTFEGVIFYTGGSSTSDIRILVATPGGSAIRTSWVGSDPTTPTTVKQEVGESIIFGASASPLSAWFRGTVVAGGNGDLQFQYCQSVTDAGNPVTAQANSHIVATQIGI